MRGSDRGIEIEWTYSRGRLHCNYSVRILDMLAKTFISLQLIKIAKSFLSLILSDANITDRSSYVGVPEILICSTFRPFKEYRTFLTEKRNFIRETRKHFSDRKNVSDWHLQYQYTGGVIKGGGVKSRQTSFILQLSTLGHIILDSYRGVGLGISKVLCKIWDIIFKISMKLNGQSF
jgi:hypothetical protein